MRNSDKSWLISQNKYRDYNNVAYFAGIGVIWSPRFFICSPSIHLCPPLVASNDTDVWEISVITIITHFPRGYSPIGGRLSKDFI